MEPAVAEIVMAGIMTAATLIVIIGAICLTYWLRHQREDREMIKMLRSDLRDLANLNRRIDDLAERVAKLEG